MDIEQWIGRTVREYYIQEKLGSGGMGTVLLAWHLRLHVHRAIKISNPQFQKNPELEKAYRARLLREARLACRLIHPNLVQMLDCFEEQGVVFLVMEFVLGETLKERVRGGTLPLEETLLAVRQACLGMEFVHSLTDDEGKPLGLVHRDLSPGNLMVTADRQGHGSLKVIDFGIARPTQALPDLSITSSSAADPSSFVGKPMYASPEQLCGMEVDARSDVYSLGAVAYQLLCGQPPLLGVDFPRTAFQRTTQPPPSLSRLSGSLWPAALDALLLKAVATKPEDRYQSMVEFRTALDRSGLPIALYLEAPDAKRAPSPVVQLRKHLINAALESGRAGVRAKTTVQLQTGLLPMVEIGPGEFMMGSPGVNSGNEMQHHVRITRAFLMGVTQVTQAQYETVIGKNPSSFKTDGSDCPVEWVNWDEATVFCNRLSEREGLTPCYHRSGDGIQCDFTAGGFRLPTEAEWEYACRAGSDTSYNLGNDEKGLERAGWFSRNSAGHTHLVRQKEANRWGLYDMHGNVWEWCWDWHDADYYAASPASDPSGPSRGANRVLRGGSWYLDAIFCRSAARLNSQPGHRDFDLGFRLVRTLR